mgnify:CR=1 FL=1
MGTDKERVEKDAAAAAAVLNEEQEGPQPYTNSQSIPGGCVMVSERRQSATAERFVAAARHNGVVQACILYYELIEE